MKIYTVADVAFLLSQKHNRMIPEWKVRRTIDKVFPDLPRVGQFRAVTEDLIPQLEQTLCPEQGGK